MPVMVNTQLGLQRWHGALVAIRAWAYAARYADWLKRGIVAQIQIIGIDELAGEIDLAAQPNGIAPHGRTKAATRFGHIARQAEIAQSIRRFGQLP